MLTQNTSTNRNANRRRHILFFISQPSLAYQKQQRSHADCDKKCRDRRKQADDPFRADGKLAYQLACLTVHGKEEIFSLPPCIQDPDGQQRVMHLAALQVDIPARFIAGGVARNRAFQRRHQRACAALVRPLPAVFNADIVFIRQKFFLGRYAVENGFKSA